MSDQKIDKKKDLFLTDYFFKAAVSLKVEYTKGSLYFRKYIFRDILELGMDDIYREIVDVSDSVYLYVCVCFGFVSG